MRRTVLGGWKVVVCSLAAVLLAFFTTRALAQEQPSEAPPAAQAALSTETPASAEATEDDLQVEDTVSPAEKEQGEEAAAAHDPAKYAAFIRFAVSKVREKVLPKLEDKMEVKHGEKMERLTWTLCGASLAGLLLLFMPIFLARKYPGKMGVLFRFSAVAAGSAVSVLLLFAAVVLLIKNVQGIAGSATNPQLMIVDASLDTIDAEAEDLVEFGQTIIEPSLERMGEDGGDVPAVILGNVSNLVKDASPFLSAAKAVKGVSFLFEYVPLLTTIIAIVVFLLGARPILRELMAMPGRAAAGEDTRGVVSAAFRFVGREFVAALGLVGAVIVLTFVSAFALSLAVRPCVHDLLTYVFENIRYVQYPDASSGTIYASLILTVLSLALNVMVVLLSSGFYLGKVQKILQARVHQGIPFGAHGKFWLWGTLALLGAQLYPFLFAEATRPLIDALSEKAYAKEEPSFTLLLLSGPLIMVVGWLIVFWAARGVKGLAFVFKYKPAAATAVATPGMMPAVPAQA